MDKKFLVMMSACLALTGSVNAAGALTSKGNNDSNNSSNNDSKEERKEERREKKKERSKEDRFEQGTIIHHEYEPGYNQAAGYNLRQGYDFFVTGSFIYWMANSDGFNEAIFPAVASISGAGVIANGDGEVVFLEPKYKPGFKVGVGYGGDGTWVLGAEWTHLHQRRHQSDSSDPDDGNLFIIENIPYDIIGDHLAAKWRLNMDLVDVSLSRPIYIGRKFIAQPFFGVRAAWFKQLLDIDLTTDPSIVIPPSLIPIFTGLDGTALTKNWGIGPRAGVMGECLLGCGFRLDGKASFSLLFTRFTKLQYKSTITTGLVDEELSSHWFKHFDTVKPQAELGLGLGWGSYFAGDRLHFDLDATYDFNVFWGQNYLRAIPDSLTHQIGASPTDLFYHGPTVTARLDF